MVHKLKVRNMVVSDIPSVVSIHHYAFQGFFLERMGSSFLTQYYCTVLEYTKSIAIVAEDNQQIVNGFAVGFVDPVRFYALLKSKKIRLIPSVILGLVSSPSLIVSALRNVLRIVNNSNITTNINECPDQLCELSSIAVSSNGKGVGQGLLNQFVGEAWAMKSSEIRLTTDADKNEKVHKFYLNNGFSLLNEEQRANRKMSCYALKRQY